MKKIANRVRKEKSKRTGTIALVLAFSAAALAVSAASHGAPVPGLNAKICTSISGVWTPDTCTIPAGSDGVASSDFKIGKRNTLDVKGSLTINAGVTIPNSGTIIVENETGVIPAQFDDSGLMAGILLLGTIDNSGTVVIQNASDNTVGIAVSVSVTSAPSGPNPLLVVPGVLANSGTITIQNTGQTQGLNNLGNLNNTASGTITIANSLTNSVGIRNRRDDSLGSAYYIVGTMTNAGGMTIANSGASDGRGISNAGSFANSATGIFTINPSAVPDDAALGMRNNGSFTNFGTLINNRGSYIPGNLPSSTWGSYNLSPGIMVNHGKTHVGTTPERTGTFYNEFIMTNLGEATSYGVLYDAGGLLINYATFYNYGLIVGGGNLGICIDEPGSSGGC